MYAFTRHKRYTVYLRRDCQRISGVESSFLHLVKEGLNSKVGEEVEETMGQILMSRE